MCVCEEKFLKGKQGTSEAMRLLKAQLMVGADGLLVLGGPGWQQEPVA